MSFKSLLTSKKRIKYFFQPKPIPEREQILSFNSVLTVPRTYSEYINELKKHGTSKICTAVWGENSIAYRCNTCALNANMAFCVECFDPDKHEGHDFYKFRTETAEGKCDCGDRDIMKPEGFCDKSSGDVTQPPEDILKSARLLLPEFMVKTCQMLLMDPSRVTERDGVEYLMLAMLEDYVDTSIHLRDIIVSCLIDKELFRSNFKNVNISLEESWLENCNVIYNYGEIHFKGSVDRSDKIQITQKDNILDTMYMWAVQYGFNATLFRLFIKLSADPTFKKHLANVFCRTYIPVMWILQRPHSFNTIRYYRFAALSSQIFTWASQSAYLSKNLSLFKYLMLYLTHILNSYKTRLIEKYSFQNVNPGVNKFFFYPVTKDWQMFLGNQQILLDLPEHPLFITIWTEIVLKFYGIERNVRLTERVDNPKEILPFKGMNADFEVCMSPVFSLIHALKEAKKPIVGTSLYKNLLKKTVKTLHSYVYDAFDISLHLSMFRILFLFFATDMRKGILTAKNLKFDHGFLKNIVYYPVRLWSAVCEMNIIYWLFNGPTIQDVARMYKVPHFSAATVDPDIFIMQLAASQLDANFVTQMVLRLFHTVNDLMAPHDEYFYAHQPGYFIDQTLLYFAILIASRALAGENDDGSLRTEVISVLATRERAKSGLLKMLPDRGVNLQYKWLEDLEQILDDVAILNSIYFGESNEPIAKTYGLKTKPFLEEYDPILAHMRSVHVGGLEESLANYYISVGRENLNPTKVSLWPPYRSPLKKHHPFLDGFTNFLHCSSFQTLLYTIFYRCMYGNMGDNTLQIAVHLLNMSFSFPFYDVDSKLPIYSICKNCLIPYDHKFNVLNDNGLMYVFVAHNRKIKVDDVPKSEKKYRAGYDKSRIFEDYNLETDFGDLPPINRENRSDETILSLLLKLFEKHTNKLYKPINMRGPEAARYGSYKSSGVRIGGAEFFIGEVLDSLVEGNGEVLSYVEDYVRARSEVEEPAREEEDRKARLKRIAQEKKAKALAKMKKKQQEFKTTITDEQEEPETADEPEEVPLCCLCSKPLFQGDIEDLPTTVVLVTRTNLMGHRICKPHPFMSRLNINTFAHNFKSILALNKKHCPNSEVVTDWYDNMWVQSCGHEMHFSCYRKYIREQMSYGQRLLPVSGRYKIFTSEFWCPYCRQLCNGVLPSLSTPIFAGPLRKPRVLDYEFILSIISEPSQVEISMESLNRPIKHILSYMVDIAQANQDQFNTLIDLLRNNLELLLMNKSLLAQEEPQNGYFPLKKLFKTIPTNLIYNICRFGIDDEERKGVKDVLEVLDPDDGDESRYNLALADAKQLLVTTVIFMSQPTHELIKSVIHFFMNLYLLQLLSWMVVAADEEEIKAWIVEENLSGTQLDFILSLALNQFQQKKRRIIKKGETREIYSETLRSRLTEFMKFCVVLYYSVLNFWDSLKEKDLESYELWDFYDLLLDGQLSGDDHISFVKCFGWGENMITIYSEKICKDIYFLTGATKDFYMVRDMMMVEWKPPKLISLPDSFDEILAIFEKKGKISFEDTILFPEQRYCVCLVCSRYIAMEASDRNEIIVKKFKHMERCGRGTCISLEPRRNTVHIIWDKRASVWDSIYVDEQGESNIPLDKITKMYLCPRRLHMLENMWLFNSFDVFAKNWDIRIH